MRSVLLASALGLLVSGCATPYQDARNPLTGWTGGYLEEPGPGELMKVGFAGNSGISQATVSTYLLYRCAELAQRDNRPYFALYRSLPSAILDRRSSIQTAESFLGKPDAYAYILYFDAPGEGLLETREVLARLAPQVRRGPL